METLDLDESKWTPEERKWILRFNDYSQERWGKMLPITELKIPKQPTWAKALCIMHPAAYNLSTTFINYSKNNVARKYVEASLDVMFGKDRREEGVYAFWHRGGKESDGEYLNLPAHEIKKRGITTMRLIEYLECANFFKWSTGNNLDMNGYTIFPETVTPFGKVAKTCWSPYDTYGLAVSIDRDDVPSPKKSVREIAL